MKSYIIVFFNTLLCIFMIIVCSHGKLINKNQKTKYLRYDNNNNNNYDNKEIERRRKLSTSTVINTNILLEATTYTLVEGTNSSINITLNVQPLDNVAVQIKNTELYTSNISFTSNEVVFTPSGYNTPQIIQISALQNTNQNEARLRTFTFPIKLAVTNSGDEGNYNTSVYANTIIINIIDDDNEMDIDFVCGVATQVDTDPRPSNNDLIYINFTESTNKPDVVHLM